MKKLLFILLIIGVLIMLRPINEIIRNNVGNIIHRLSIVTGEVAVDNGDGSYDVFISGDPKAYPKIFTLARDPDIAVGDTVRILYKNGDKNNPVIWPPEKPTAPPILTLISCDTLYGVGKIYIHVGITSEIASSFNAPLVGYWATPTGLTIANGNLIDCGNGKIHIHDGITSTITNTFDSPGTNPTGLAFDGTNLISCDQTTDKIYIHDGISSSILSSFDAPVIGINGIYGLTYDGTNLISCNIGYAGSSNKIYIHDGITAVILDNFEGPDSNPNGLAFDGNNLISCNATTNKIYIHEGITSVITSSFNSPGPNVSGLTVLIE